MATLRWRTIMGSRWRAVAISILRSRLTVLAFCLLLAVDLFFVFAHFYFYLNNRFHFSSFQFSNNFILIKDRGYSESWEYAKIAASAALLSYVYARCREPIYLALALLSFWLLADNAFELHEQAGSALTPLYSFAEQNFASAAQTFGEMTYFAVTGIIFAIIFFAAFRASDGQHRVIAVIFGALIFLLAIFGVGIDALHAMLRFKGEIIDHAFTIIEDGGELVVISAIAAVAAFTAICFATVVQLDGARLR